MHRNLRLGGIHSAFQQTLLDELVVKILANKYHFTDPWFVWLKRFLGGSEVDLLVDPLEHKSFIPVLRLVECEHTFGAVDIRGFRLQKRRHETVEQDGVQVAVDGESDRGDQ